MAARRVCFTESSLFLLIPLCQSARVNPLQPLTAPPALVSAEPYLVGVEVGPLVIRAAAYDAAFRCLGKVKLSTKLERGPEAVSSRVARCVQYVADECDLRLPKIGAVGVGVPGRVEAEKGCVVSSSLLGWQNVRLKDELEKTLSLPVFLENNFNLATLGIGHTELVEREWTGPPRRLAALFPGPRLGGGLMEDGRLLEVGAWFEGVRENVFALMPGEEFQHFRGKDFKKALRQGHPAVAQYVRALGVRTGQIAAQIIREFQPHTVAIGGGVLDEMRDELMEIIQHEAASPASVCFVASALGDYAALAGAAALASRRSEVGSAA